MVGLVVLLAAVLVGVDAQNRRPTISFITQPEIVTDIGGDIEMKCTIQYASDYPVIWMKLDSVDRNNDLPITTGTTLILTDPRFNVELDTDTSTYILRIRDIQETDGAVYQCQVLIALTDKVKADVPLIVRRPPIISDNSTRSVVALEGRRVELRCYASGYPLPEIWWRRQNNKPLPTMTSVFKGNVLVFENVTKDHRGTYYCVATNVVGTGARRNINVEVEHKPVISIPRKRLGQALQFDMDLECKIEAYPPPAIRWFREGDTEPITNNQHFQISHFAHDDEYVDTILRVRLHTITSIVICQHSYHHHHLHHLVLGSPPAVTCHDSDPPGDHYREEAVRDLHLPGREQTQQDRWQGDRVTWSVMCFSRM